MWSHIHKVVEAAQKSAAQIRARWANTLKGKYRVEETKGVKAQKTCPVLKQFSLFLNHFGWRKYTKREKERERSLLYWETRQGRQPFNLLRLQDRSTESPSVHFWVLEVPSPDIVCAKDAWSLWSVTMELFCHSFPVRLMTASSTISCWDPPVTPEIQMGSSPS